MTMLPADQTGDHRTRSGASLEDLVAQAQTGDTRAFDGIVRRLQDMAHATALARLADYDLAADASQDAFVEAYRSLDRLRAPAAFLGWFRRIVERQCGRVLRRRSYADVPSDACEPDAGTAHDPVAMAAARERRAEARRLLDGLPEHERIAALLFYLEEYSLAEIADYLTITVTTVKQRLHSARKRIGRMETMLKDDITASRPSQDDRFANRVKLMTASAAGDVPTILGLLDADPDLIHIGGESTPLHAAAMSGRVEAVRVLLRRGAAVNARDRGDNATPLHHAAERAPLAAIELLVDHGADVNATDDGHERGPLGWATVFGEVRRDVAEYLMRRGARPDIFTAVALRDEALIREKAARDPSVLEAHMSKFEDHRTPLEFARAKRNEPMARLLSELGAAPSGDVAASPEENLRAARVAIDADDREGLERLLDRTPNLIARLEDDDRPPVGRAAAAGAMDVLRLLLDRGAGIETVDRAHRVSPLGWAAFAGSAAAAAILVERGAVLDHRNAYDTTPLGTALAGLRGEMVRWGGPIDVTVYEPIVALLRGHGAAE